MKKMTNEENYTYIGPEDDDARNASNSGPEDTAEQDGADEGTPKYE